MRLIRTFQVVGEQMAMQMVDGVRVQIARIRNGLRGGDPHHKAAREPRTARDRDAIEFVEVHAGFVHRKLDHRVERFGMFSTCDLRNDAAVLAVEFILTGQNIRFARPAVDHDGRCRIIARSFDAEETHAVRIRDRRSPPLNAQSVDGARAAWIAIVLVVVSLPHAIEDFAFGEPARVGVAPIIALCALLVAYAVQGLGAWLALRENPWGGRFIAATGFVWFVGALVIHGPEIRAQGWQWRFGLTSIGELMLIVIASALAMWYGLIAAQSASRRH
jgi:hypothetical protein